MDSEIDENEILLLGGLTTMEAQLDYCLPPARIGKRSTPQ